MKVAILGAGYIGGIMAETIKGMAHEDIELYAVGARDIKRAEEFACTEVWYKKSLWKL